MSKTIAVIQARLNSSRLPNKVLYPIFGNNCSLDLMIKRIKQCKQIDEIRLAFGGKPSARLMKIANKYHIDCFFWKNTDDVLSRMYYTCKRIGGIGHDDIIVRLTGDCPLIDPELVDAVVYGLKESDSEYHCNCIPPRYPDGMDCEAFYFSALENAHRYSCNDYDREHVTPWIRRNCNCSITPSEHSLRPDLRLTLDTQEDLQLICKIYNALGPINKLFTLDDIIRFLDDHPEIVKINQHLSRNYNCKEPSNE